MLKKRALVGCILIGMLLVLANGVFAEEEKCCISTRSGCAVMFAGDDALCTAQGGEFFNGPCSSQDLAPRCSIGCCTSHGGALRQPKYAVSCTSLGGELVNTNPFEASIPADICGGILECREDAQCPPNTRCDNGICIPGTRAETPRCENTVQDAGESDVDCGGTCPPCAQEKRCTADRDCRAGLKCDADTHRCVAHKTNCRNGVVDPGEDCDFEAGSSRILFKQGVSGCTDVESEPGKKFTGGTLACNSFCRFDTDVCTYIPPAERKTAPTGTCGDGTLNTPNQDYVVETCEIGISRCAAGSVCGCTVSDQCEPTDCACSSACETPAPTVEPLQTNAQDATTISWIVPPNQNACPLTSQHVLWCDNKKTNCATLPKSQWQSSADLNPARREFEKKAEKTWCFAVELNYQNKPAVVSDSICLEECVAGQRFCDVDDAEKKKTNVCTAGLLRPGESCASGTYCTEPSAGVVECKEPDPCAKCNGAFQMFAGVLFDQPGIAVQQACQEITGCIYDKSETTVNQFRNCQEVQNCYAYRTKYACENDESHCKVAAGGCAWQTTNAELGLGICTPADEKKQQCDVCSTTGTANDLLGGCTKESCELFGDACYFSTGDNACQDVKSLGCNDYNDAGKPVRAEEECVGSQRSMLGVKAVEADVRYDGPIRSSGTNRITKKSNDRFNFGLCKWGSEPGERCFKDADGNGVDDCSFVQNQEECNRDFAVPETSIVAEQLTSDANGRLKIGKFMDIPVRVSEPATTFFCLDHNCYPKNYTICRIQKILTTGDQTASRLNFYSQDRANNLEEVKHQDITVNINPPRKVREQVVGVPADSPRKLQVNLEYTDDVVCNAKLTNIKGDEVSADETPTAQLKSNAIANEHGRVFTREYHNLKDDVYVFTYDCVNEFGNTDQGQDVKIIDTNKIHITTSTFGGSEPITSAHNIIARVQTDEPAACHIKAMGTSREFVSFNAADAEPMQPNSERKEHTKNVELKDDLNIFQVACQFDGQPQLDGNRADRIIISKDVFPPTITFFGTIDKTVTLEPGSYGTAQNVFAYCSDSRVKNQYGLEGLDYGCGEISMNVNSQPVSFAFAADQKEGFIPPFTPFLVGNAFQGGTSTLEITALRAKDTQNHESVAFEREPYRIAVADAGLGTITDTARVTLYDALGNQLQANPPPSIPKDSYRIKINTGRVANLENVRATIAAQGLVKEGNILRSEGPRKENVGTLSRADCQLEGISTVSCGIDLRRLRLEDAGVNEKDFYTLEVVFEPVSVLEKGTECFPGEQSQAQLAMNVQTLTITLVTATPELQLEPIFSSLFFEADDEWNVFSEEHEYPIQYYPNEGLAYTNQRELFITGILKHPDITKKIEYYTGRCGGAQVKQKEFNPHDDYTEQRDALTTTAVNPPTGITRTLSLNTLPLDLSGKFLQFSPVVDENGDVQKEYHRNQYGVFRHHYAITNVKLGTPNNLTLDASLEEVPERIAGQVGIPITIFAKPAEENVFGETVALEEGCNTFAAKGIGSILENDIVISPSFPNPAHLAGIIVDSEGPRVVGNSPSEGTTNEAVTNVSIVVEEGSDGTFDAPLIKDSISVTIIPTGTAPPPREEAGEEAEGEELFIAGEGCERNICKGTSSGTQYTYFIVSDRLVDENTGDFIEGIEKPQLLETFEWEALHDDYLDQALGEDTGAVEGVITARLADRDGKMVIKTDELEGKRRYTITYRNDEPFEGGQLIIFKGIDKATNKLAASPTGKPSWAFNINDGTPTPPEWEFLAPAVKNNGTFYAKTNVNVKIDYSSNEEPVTIGEQNPDGSINGRLFFKRFDASLGQEDPMPARCERVQRNIFVCNPQDFTPEQFNKAYTLVVEARLKLSNEVEGPAGRHVSPVLVTDNQAPTISSIDIPQAVAYNGVLRLTLTVQDSGFDLKGRAVFDVPEQPSLRREVELKQAEHQIGTNNYLFEWNLEPERFRLTDEGVLSQPHPLTVFIDDYAGTTPSATSTRNTMLDFRGPDESAWKVDINTPFSIPEEKKYFTREASIKINGSFADNDICPTCIFVSPGNYLPGADTYDGQQMATILELPAKRFTTNLRLKAVENQVVNQTYTITIKDIAGFNKTQQFTIITDRRPPEQVSLNII